MTGAREAAVPAIPLARLFAMAARALTDDLHARLAELGWTKIPPAAGYVLLACRTGATSGGEVAELMRTSKQAASKLLDGLEADGLVERGTDTADGRRKVVRLAPRGHELLAAVERVYQELEARWAAAIGADAVETVRMNVTRALLDAHGGRLPAIGPVAPRP